MNFAMMISELQSGESFSGAPHKHLNQEELFYVSEGTANWELAEGPGADREMVTTGQSEAIHLHDDDVYPMGSNQSEEVVR